MSDVNHNRNVIAKWLEGRTRNLGALGPAVLRDATIKVYKKALENTPQWSGHMASNLTIQISNTFSPGTNAFLKPYQGRSQKPIYKKGDRPAMELANERNRWVNTVEDMNIKTRTRIFYAAEPSEAYYSSVEAGNNLRGVNEPGMALYTALKMLPNYAYYKFEPERYGVGEQI